MMPDSTPNALKLSVAFYMHDLSGGGVERMRLKLIDSLRARGVEVSLIVGSKRGELAPLLPEDLPLIELNTLRTWRGIPGLVRYLRTAQPDVLISSLDHNNIAAIIASILAGAKTRLIICQHNALSEELARGLRYRIVPLGYRILHRFVSAAVAVSRGVANDLCSLKAIPRSKISVIYNPVLEDDFAARCAGAAPHPWLTSKRMPVFVFVGRLTAQKDPLNLLKAMRLMLKTCQGRLILVGDGEEEAALRRFVVSRGIAHAVAFAGFQLNPLPWIKHADVLISSSRYEGFGNAIVEALACGTQVIATDCPHGPSEVLLEGILGTLVPVGDPEALAEAMTQIGANRVDAEKLRARAAGFTAAACADAHLALCRRIMTGRGRIVHALGMEISPLSTEQVVETIVTDKSLGRLRLMVTPNLHHVKLLRKPEFAAAYAEADLVCPDGLPVLLYARLFGLKLRSRVTGCEVFGLLIREPGLRWHRLFFLVESQETKAAALSWADNIGMAKQIAIAVAPPELDSDMIGQAILVRRIKEAAPTILVVTLGAPASELFVHRHLNALPPCWALCVGQALRVELGLARRAPFAWRKLGLEWLWRLRHEPRRLVGRYASALAWFPIAILRDLGDRQTAKGG